MIENNQNNSMPAAFYTVRAASSSSSALRTELIRKSIHFLIALAPSLAAIDRTFTVMLLGAGALVYAYAESVRLAGGTIPIISALTAAAARERDRGRFVLGPITLGLGAMLALLLYPDPAASLAIYALAFGDGFAGLIGKFFGKTRPRFLMGKSVEGSAACFVAVFVIALRMTADVRTAVFAALVAVLVEALPLEDFDNLALPMSVGLVTRFFEFI
jgi:dolichol kinase